MLKKCDINELPHIRKCIDTNTNKLSGLK